MVVTEDINLEEEQYKISQDTKNLPSKDCCFKGRVYVLEYNEHVKIGCTSSLRNRIMTLRHSCEKYNNGKLGRILYSKRHVNYRENEKELHSFFKNNRIEGTELFNATIEQVLDKFNQLEFSDKEKERSERYKLVSEGMADFMTGKIFLNFEGEGEFFKMEKLNARNDTEINDMMIEVLLDVNADAIKKELGVAEGESIRPFLSQEQIDLVEELQRVDIGLLTIGMEYEERKTKLTAVAQRRIIRRYRALNGG